VLGLPGACLLVFAQFPLMSFIPFVLSQKHSFLLVMQNESNALKLSSLFDTHRGDKPFFIHIKPMRG
jgi:hypothetical protein